MGCEVGVGWEVREPGCRVGVPSGEMLGLALAALEAEALGEGEGVREVVTEAVAVAGGVAVRSAVAVCAGVRVPPSTVSVAAMEKVGVVVGKEARAEAVTLAVEVASVVRVAVALVERVALPEGVSVGVTLEQRVATPVTLPVLLCVVLRD